MPWTALVWLTAFTSVTCGQLPDESQLPGRRNETQGETSAALPAESALPARFASKKTPPSQPSTPEAPKPSAPAQEDLPSEADLPSKPGTAEPDQGEANQPDREEVEQLLRLKQSEDARPWLRILQRAPIDRVRALCFSDDSKRLLVGGDDKDMLSYRLVDGEFRFERTIRWQIQRGPAGRIYTADTASNYLAFSGYSAMGSLGEIGLYDAATGKLQQTLHSENNGHRQSLTALAFSPNAASPTLASMDQNGRLLHWRRNANTGFWESSQIDYDPSTAEELQLDRALHPVAMLDQERILAPRFLGRTEDNITQWGLRIHDVAKGTFADLGNDQGEHDQLLTAMAVTANGQLAATADARGKVFLWNLDSGNVFKRQLDSIVTSLAFSNEGKTLVIGTGLSGPRKILVWNTENPESPKPQRETPLDRDVDACRVSPDGRWIAFNQGPEVHVQSMSENRTRILRGDVIIPARVAFSKAAPYRLAISYASQTSDKADDHLVFDPQTGQLDNSIFDSADWNTAKQESAGWSVLVPDQGNEVWLTRDGEQKGRLPLDVRMDGFPTAVCWLERGDAPYAVVVATAGNNNLFVFGLAERGDCPLRRVFRGHTGRVSSIDASHDQRYLASTGSEGVTRIWKLEGLDASILVNRWGATFKEEAGKVVVDAIRTDGPLYFRGLRSGDTIERLIHVDVEQGVERVTTLADSESMLNSLERRDRKRLTAFSYRRGRAPVANFQSYPAWQPVASLFINHRREWAYWTPAGIYDASFEGHKLFGWQVNRGPAQIPDFFLAAQVRGFLERPNVMSRLLESGDLTSAFEQANVGTPGNWANVLNQQRSLLPEVEIISPAPSTVVDDNTITVEAVVRSQPGQRIVPPKAFVNGIIGTARERTGVKQTGTLTETRFRWSMRLPSERQLLLQVIAATEDEVAGQASVRLERSNIARPAQPRMFVLASGINQYRDPQIPRLDFAVDNAIQLSEALASATSPLYATNALTLTDDNVTRSAWNLALETTVQQLREELTPDDLLVIFLSGHGVRDVQSDQYFYLSADAAYRDVQSARYGDCLSLADFGAFENIPCRKLVILDTCHSGAVQPMRQRELKYALRALQDDLFLTLTATEGAQEAVEARARKLGRFTFHLLAGLRGAADSTHGDGDQTVTFRELADYVRAAVPADAESESTVQHPTAGPSELIDLIHLPLTQTQNQVRASRDGNPRR